MNRLALALAVLIGNVITGRVIKGIGGPLVPLLAVGGGVAVAYKLVFRRQW